MSDPKKIKVPVLGMHCAGCAANLEKALMKKGGVISADISITSEDAVIEYDPSEISLREIDETVSSIGFTIPKKSLVIHIGGMDTPTCASKAQAALLKLEGCIKADVSLSENTANTVFLALPDTANEDDIDSVLAEAGFDFISELTTDIPIEEEEEEKKEHKCGSETCGSDKSGKLHRKRRHRRTEAEITAIDEFYVKENKEIKKRIFIGIPVTILLFVISYLGSSFSIPDVYIPYILFIIATPTYFYMGLPIFKSAGAALKNFSLNMDFMYTLGTGTAYISSIIGTFHFFSGITNIFYDTCLMLLTFLLIGRYLEGNAKRQTNTAVKELLKLKAKTAILITAQKENIEYITNRDCSEIDAVNIKVGDKILIKPGSAVPTDGVIISGELRVDESAITGESVPVKRTIGEKVMGGTINSTGSAIIKASAIGNDTILSKIIMLLEDTQRQRPQIQKIADKAVKYFIPAVLIFAIASALIWHYYYNAPAAFIGNIFVAVIVIACPCALGLASPTATAVGIGRAARLGILIKNSDVFELSNKIKCAVFDKTGTLTEGKPTVSMIIPCSGIAEDTAIRAAASVEVLSEHPIGSAIAMAAKDKGLEYTPAIGFKLIPGKGVCGISKELSDEMVYVGNIDCIKDAGFKIPQELADQIEVAEEARSEGLVQNGTTLILVAGQLSGVIALFIISDRIKPDAKAAVAALKRDGMHTVMITGDCEDAAENISIATGLDEHYSRAMPADKLEIITKLQEKYGPVLYAGDGINDAPALAKADIGIAVSNGTDIAFESADAVLMHSGIADAVNAIRLFRKVMGRIKLNLFWAFFYNVILLPIAAGVLYLPFGIMFAPEFSAFAMMFSSLTVVTLSLALLKYKPPEIQAEQN